MGLKEIISINKYNEERKGNIMHFNCGDEFVNDQLRYNCHGTYKDSTPHLYVENTELLGYISLRNTSLVLKNQMDNGGKIIDKGYPAIEIYQLGIDEEYKKKGYGKELIQYAIGLAKEIDKAYSQVEYIVLHSKKETVEFYKKLNFEIIGNDTKTEGTCILKEADTGDCVAMYLKI